MNVDLFFIFRIMYIESEAESLNGSAQIDRVTFSVDSAGILRRS